MKLARLVLVGTLSLGAVSLSACRKSDDTEKKAEKAEGTVKEKKSARPKPPPVDEGIDVPTEEDFEESAVNQITESSDLQKELDQLEKEIGE